MVGSAIAADLSAGHTVTSADLNVQALERLREAHPAVTTKAVNVTDKTSLTAAIAPFDLVVCAVPGFLGFETLKTIIGAGKNVIDISFFPEDSLDLHELAVEKGVTAIVDTGVAPGMDNYILGHLNEQLTITHFECVVGGLPKQRKPPFEYKAPFSPVDVIEEYTRPARYKENDEIVTVPALTDIELLDFERPGPLESFNTDGLRSILHTMPHIPNMKEKTLRYPGHAARIQLLVDAGLLSEEPVEVNGAEISPRDLTSRLLFKAWKLGPEEPEITVMRVTVRGTDETGKTREIKYDLYDEYDPATRTSSMARTTGYTATAAVNMFLDGLFDRKGVFPPELIGGNKSCFDYIMSYLEARGVIYTRSERIPVS